MEKQPYIPLPFWKKDISITKRDRKITINMFLVKFLYNIWEKIIVERNKIICEIILKAIILSVSKKNWTIKINPLISIFLMVWLWIADIDGIAYDSIIWFHNKNILKFRE